MSSPAGTSSPARGIRWQAHGRVRHLVLDRPAKKNALSASMRAQIVGLLGRWASDDDVSTVVVSGAGGTFCAGLDRAELLAADDHTRGEVAASSGAFHRAVAGFGKPLVAAVDGHALGTGFDLAVMCDIRVSTARARFGHPEVRLGAVAVYLPLRLIVGDGWARELCLTGRTVDARTAATIGLVTHLVEEDQLDAEALRLAQDIAEVPLATLRASKALFTADPPVESWMVREHDDVFAAGLTAGRERTVRG